MVKCVCCGYCCTKGACAFGDWNEIKHQCKHLTEDKLCGKYREIINQPAAKFNPAFGAGCCMSLFNSFRERKIKQMLDAGIIKSVFDLILVNM